MARKFEAFEIRVRDLAGNTYKRREANLLLRNIDKSIHEVPRRTAKKIPKTFTATINNKVRGYWRQNYLNKEDWSFDDFKNEVYKRDKDRMLQNKDVFIIAGIGKRPVIAGGEVYGKQTGSLFNDLISNTSRHEIRTGVNVERKGKVRGFDLAIGTRLKTEDYEGVTMRQSGKTGTVTKTTASNRVEAFSWLISGRSGITDSVLVRLQDFQLSEIRRYVKNQYNVLVREVVRGQLWPPNIKKAQ